jgi:hypothetical protein
LFFFVLLCCAFGLTLSGVRVCVCACARVRVWVCVCVCRGSSFVQSLHHKDHILPCTAPNALKIMYDEQISGFQRAGVSNFFWGWKMPQGGTHEPMWSLKLHLLGQH